MRIILRSSPRKRGAGLALDSRLRGNERENNGGTMARRIIDISVALKAGIASDPPYMLPQIDYVDHKAGADNFHQVFGVPIDQLPDGAGPAVENVSRSRPTTARISMRRITSTPRWITASRR